MYDFAKFSVLRQAGLANNGEDNFYIGVELDTLEARLALPCLSLRRESLSPD